MHMPTLYGNMIYYKAKQLGDEYAKYNSNHVFTQDYLIKYGLSQLIEGDYITLNYEKLEVDK